VKSDTELEFTIAPGSASGPIKITNAYGTGQSAVDFNVIQTLGLPYTIVAEGLNADWQLWGWGNTTTLESTEQATVGTKSAKVVYSDAWGGFQTHPAEPNPFDITSATKFKVSIYGGANSNGKNVGLYVKPKGSAATSTKQMTLVEGQWTTFEFPLSDIGSPESIDELVIQNQGNANLVMYVDEFKLL
jgi:hypothetical protein